MENPGNTRLASMTSWVSCWNACVPALATQVKGQAMSFHLANPRLPCTYKGVGAVTKSIVFKPGKATESFLSPKSHVRTPHRKQGKEGRGPGGPCWVLQASPPHLNTFKEQHRTLRLWLSGSGTCLGCNKSRGQSQHRLAK